MSGDDVTPCAANILLYRLVYAAAVFGSSSIQFANALHDARQLFPEFRPPPPLVPVGFEDHSPDCEVIRRLPTVGPGDILPCTCGALERRPRT